MHHQNQSTFPKYRADIDGLRAIAILLVVFFHVCNFGGGFVGVDIFFVISGFLISTIIINGLESGNFSFADFYARRIKRIFPALLLVLFFTIIFGWFALFPLEYVNLNKHIFRASYFVSNFHLLKENSDYFNNASEVKPLLHLWSLAIEEQFYIIWPLVLLLFWKTKEFLRNFKLNILAIALLFAAGSFGFGLHKIFHHKEAAFYLPQCRFWELLIGAILAIIIKQKQGVLASVFIRCTKSALLSNFLSILGLSLIALAALLIKREGNFPGALALMPTCGAALIISAGQDAWVNKNILKNPILVWFGLISFPLYLWHWPLLSFLCIIQNGHPELSAKILVVLLSILLSWLTYQFVERPIRFGGNSRVKVLFLVALMAILSGLSVYLYKTSALGVYVEDSRDLIRTNKVDKHDKSCEIFGINNAGIICVANSSKPKLMIVGDSHATSLDSAIRMNEFDRESILVSANSCLPFDKYSPQTELKHDDCRNLAVQIKVAIKNIDSIKTVLISTYAPEDTDKENDFEEYGLIKSEKESSKDIFLKGYSDFIAELIAAGKKVVFVVDVAKLQYGPESCVTRIFNDKPFHDCKIDRKIAFEKENSYKMIVTELKKRNPQLILFYSSDVFCDDKYCYGRDANNIFYYDKHHISVAGSKKLLEAIFKNPLLND